MLLEIQKRVRDLIVISPENKDYNLRILINGDVFLCPMLDGNNEQLLFTANEQPLGAWTIWQLQELVESYLVNNDQV